MGDKLLLEEAPVSIFQPQLAAWIGLNEAILLQHVHYLTGQEKFGQIVDGVKWIRMTIEEWAKELPCFDPSTIKRTLTNLEEDNLLISTTFTGRSKWYRVDCKALKSISEPVERLANRVKARTKAINHRHNASVQNEPIETKNRSTDCPNTLVQNEPMYRFKMNQPSVQNEPLPRSLSENITPNGVSGKPPEGPKNRDGPKWQLMNEFTSLTGLEIPTDKPTEKFWWGRIGVIYKVAKEDSENGKKLMREAIDKLGLENVYDPNSLLKTIRKIIAEKNYKPKVSFR